MYILYTLLNFSPFTLIPKYLFVKTFLVGEAVVEQNLKVKMGSTKQESMKIIK
jgi:hypothetical protein